MGGSRSRGPYLILKDRTISGNGGHSDRMSPSCWLYPSHLHPTLLLIANCKRYWEFMAYFVVATSILQLFFGSSEFFVGLLGYCALGVEATLPIPQVLANQRARSCKGFRLSVLVSWLLGDIMKTIFFFSSEHVGLQFKLCAGIQFALDAYLGVQFWMFGNSDNLKDLEMS